MNGPQVAWLADGRRLHLNHGPIDLIVETFGEEDERRKAHDAAVARFQTILTELVSELAELRRAVASKPRRFAGLTAMRMERAAQKFHPEFITPMAAVAGAVADEVMASIIAVARLDKAYVNNGGDIALHLSGDGAINAAIAGTGHGFADRLVIRTDDPVRGIATSGWRGRSFSLGIADAVTVLAKNAAEADAAATMIANAVDLPGHPAITRQPANELAPDTDLGSRLVTTDVGPIGESEAREALQRGAVAAKGFRERGLIHAAALFLAGESIVVEYVPATTLRVVPLSGKRGRIDAAARSDDKSSPTKRGRGTAEGGGGSTWLAPDPGETTCSREPA